MPRSLLLEKSEILAAEDPERFLQRENFFLAARHTVLVANAGVNARGLQFLIVLHGSAELLRRRVQVGLFLLQLLF